jgi:hypothetical protein
MSPETIRLVPEGSTPSQVRTNIETLFAAHKILETAKRDRENKYLKDSREKLDAAASELKATVDAARVVQKQKDLANLKNQCDAETAAFDYIMDKINRRLEDLTDSNPEEMIEVLERKLEHLRNLIDEADDTEKRLDKDLRELQRKKAALERRIRRKGAQQPSAAQE